VSDISAATEATRMSVNEVLSVAGPDGVEDASLLSLDLNEALEGQGDLTFQSLMRMDNDQQQQQSLPTLPGQPEETTPPTQTMRSSMASVVTVQENVKKETSPVQAEQQQPEQLQTPQQEMEVDALYDDVMQCVYDDVDIRYDNLDLAEAPPPPARVASMSISANEEKQPELQLEDASPDKPLPGTPSKLPAILQKMSKSGDTLKKKTKAEEAKKSSPKKTVERRQKASAKEGKKGPSLFQRVMHRSKSQSELAAVTTTVTTSDANANGEGSDASPSSLALDGVNGNASPAIIPASPPDAPVNGEEPTEADLHELQSFLESGDLDHLDNMVTEFAAKYLPEETGANNNEKSVAAPSAVS